MSIRRKSPPATSRFHHFEPLESRQMMAGNLTANLTSGTLFINEAPFSLGQDQAVQVSQNFLLGRITVTGKQTADGGTTLINGKNSVTFISRPTNIVVGLGAGHDKIEMFNTRATNIQILAEAPGNPPPQTKDDDIVTLVNVKTKGVLDIRTGLGRDNVTVLNSVIGDNIGVDDLKITTGVATAVSEADHDVVILNGVVTRSATQITTGASTDIVDIQNSTLGNDKSDFLSIKTGAGTDSVAIAPAAGTLGNFQSVGGIALIQTFDNAAENDSDTVKLQQLVVESAVVSLGDGANDRVDMLAVTAAKTIIVDGGGGADTVKMTEVEALDTLFAMMGDGNDVLEQTFVRARNSMTLDGGGGFDTLNRFQSTFVPNLTIKNWEMINGKPVLTANLDNVVLTATKV
ncbi:MAG: hypothetical protein DME65_03875 [Verrucomicrobia bacterium]|nr:MAG: hypothetical protein DME65_03875 [Verrucomicrobiota bacterium]